MWQATRCISPQVGDYVGSQKNAGETGTVPPRLLHITRSPVSRETGSCGRAQRPSRVADIHELARPGRAGASREEPTREAEPALVGI